MPPGYYTSLGYACSYTILGYTRSYTTLAIPASYTTPGTLPAVPHLLYVPSMCTVGAVTGRKALGSNPRTYDG